MKKFWFMLTPLVATCFLVACRGSQGVSTKTIKENKKIVVATESEFAPFEFKSLVNGKDTLVGADIELAKAIGKKLGVKVEFSVMSFDNVLASVQSGKADIAIAGISVTDERKKVYDFSDSYYTSENVVSLASNGEMINELKSGQIQAGVLEKAIAEGYIAQNDDLTLASFNLKSDGSDAYAVAIRKGSDDLLKEINAVIKETKESGKFDQWLKEASSYKQSK